MGPMYQSRPNVVVATGMKKSKVNVVSNDTFEISVFLEDGTTYTDVRFGVKILKL